jgi:demethylmenaquinone methyltransferase/2-methoxy-6-polyprenyl-1,4-benzoquinol methylase
MTDDLLAAQVAYYRARAPEYDATSWVDLDAARPRIERVLDDLEPRGRAVELACGTGAWTGPLARRVDQLVAVDASPEVIDLARQRTPAEVRFEVGDAFTWRPPEQVDTVFFGFWLSHVPTSRLAAFFAHLASMLGGSGRVLFVDEHPAHANPDARPAPGSEIAVRRLGDGSEHRLVKVERDPDELAARLAVLGWSAVVAEREEWLIGTATPR